MSQSATLYRITQDNFKEVTQANGKKVNPLELAEEYTTFQGSFMALTFILSKGQDADTQKLMEEIFEPESNLGDVDMSTVDFDDIEDDELGDLLDAVAYIPSEQVQKINAVLSCINEEQVSNAYNAQELNDNRIYPGIWHDDNAKNKAYNKRQILEDFIHLKDFFQKAADAQNYILSYVG